MKSLIVAVCSWPATELYWNITARYEFPFFVTVVALLVWLFTVKVEREPVRDQCAAAGVPFFYKQWWGQRPVKVPPLDGRQHTALPRT